MAAEQITIEEFHARLRAQGVAREDLAFKCPICKTVQSGRSLIRAGAGAGMDDVERYIGFNCVGRWTAAGPHKPKEPPGRGCDWSLGGLFQLHELTVQAPDGRVVPYFAVASAEEALALSQAEAQREDA